MSYEPDEYGPDEYDQAFGPDTSAAAARTNVPGLMMIVTGFLNLLGAAFFAFTGVMALTMSPEEFAKAQAKGPFAGQPMDPQQIKFSGMFYLGLAVVAVIASLLTIAAGFNMRALRLYGLAVTGAALTALPCISPMSCCGFGEVVGIWALIV